MATNSLHVVKREGGWAVRRESSQRDSAKAATQGEAINIARDMAKRQGADIVIHRPDGSIREGRSYAKAKPAAKPKAKPKKK